MPTLRARRRLLAAVVVVLWAVVLFAEAGPSAGAGRYDGGVLDMLRWRSEPSRTAEIPGQAATEETDPAAHRMRARWSKIPRVEPRPSPSPSHRPTPEEFADRGRERLRALLDRGRDPSGVVFPLFSNAAWVELAVNAARQLRAAGVHGGVFVYAMDDETCGRAAELEPGLACYRNDSVEAFERGDLRWGTQAYFRLIDERLDAVLWILESTPYHVFMLDTDTWIREDPRRHLGGGPPAFGGVDLRYQEEVPAPRLVETIPVLNGGCWFARNADATREWVRRSLDYMVRVQKPDQDAMNYALRSMGASIVSKAFPGGLFPNGFRRYLARAGETEGSDGDPPLPAFAHANWIIGLNGKFLRLFDDGAWRLPNHDHASRPEWTRDPASAFDPLKVLKWPRRDDAALLARDVFPRRSDGTLAPEHRGFRFSFREQLDRVLKLLHLGLLLERPVSFPKVLCRPDAPKEACGLDLLLEFRGVDDRIPLLPDAIDRLPHADRFLDLEDLGELARATASPEAAGSAGETPEGLEIWWVLDDADLSYAELARRHPLPERLEEPMRGLRVLSGPLSEDLDQTLGRFERRPFLCVYDDAAREDGGALERALHAFLDAVPSEGLGCFRAGEDNRTRVEFSGCDAGGGGGGGDSRGVPVYWVHVDPFRRPTADARRARVQSRWDAEVIPAYSSLWHGMLDLEGHVLPGYAQHLVCNLAHRVFVNADPLLRDGWFLEDACGEAGERCVFV